MKLWPRSEDATYCEAHIAARLTRGFEIGCMREGHCKAGAGPREAQASTSMAARSRQTQSRARKELLTASSRQERSRGRGKWSHTILQQACGNLLAASLWHTAACFAATDFFTRDELYFGNH